VLPELPHVWWSIPLPGHWPDPLGWATYAGVPLDKLPPIERELDDELGWLLREPPVEQPLDEWRGRATREHLESLLGGESVALPRSFATFVAFDEPRKRMRSCTDCYVDFGELVPTGVDGGLLIQFLADSQSVLFWLLYVAPDGSEAVVVTDRALGRDLGDAPPEGTRRVFEPDPSSEAVCSESFSEFLYRFWIENEIWFNHAGEAGQRRPLTNEQRRYLEHWERRYGSAPGTVDP